MTEDHQEPAPSVPSDEERLKKIEEELERVKQTVFAEPESDEQMNRRMADFEARAKAARRTAEPVISPGGVAKQSMTNTRDTGVALAVAYNVLGCTIGGWAIGWVIDSFAHTKPMGQAMGALIGAVAGITAAIWLALKAESTRPK